MSSYNSHIKKTVFDASPVSTHQAADQHIANQSFPHQSMSPAPKGELQEIANQSEQVQQLQAIQRMADQSPQIQLGKGYQGMVAEHPSDTTMGKHMAVVQRVGPEYGEGSPEKKQMRNMIEWWDVLDSLFSHHEIEQRDLYDQKAVLIRNEMPSIPYGRILGSIVGLSGEPLEVVIKDLLMKCTDKELEAVYIGGRFNKWKLIKEELGEGSEAKVYWGFQLSGGKQVAIKIFKGNGQGYETAFRNEIEAHGLLSKFEKEGNPIPNVVRMLDYNTYIKSVVMEQVPGYPLDKLEKELNAEKEKPVLKGKEGKIDIEEIMKKMRERRESAYQETRTALLKQGYALADLQDRNIMYDRFTNKITFIDISLRKV